MNNNHHQTFLQDLAWRGLVYQKTNGIERALQPGTAMYWGFDLTGESLHIGHLLGVVVLRRALNYGMRVIPMPAGGTTLIGDPSGKDAERPLLSKQIIARNRRMLTKQLLQLLPGKPPEVRVVDNADWLTKIGFIEFQREVGKYFPINTMLEKESVKTRLEREQGMSFAEFSYQLLQAYDFLVLFEKYKCTVQIAGSDQWGNMVQGVELIRKRLGKQAYALSWPLIVNPVTGKKFGKTEEGESVWLDPAKTHPFKFYQFFINCDDDMAPMLLRYFSFKSKNEIERIEQLWNTDRGSRLLQKELAYELTAFVHGKIIANRAQTITSILFEQNVKQLTLADISFVKQALPYATISSSNTFSLEDALVTLGLSCSKSESKRLIAQNGAQDTVLFGTYHVIRKGKREYGIIEIT